MADNQTKKVQIQPTQARDLENKSLSPQATGTPSKSGDKPMQLDKNHGGARAGSGRKSAPETAFGRWIEEKGLTRAEVAERLQIGLSALSKLARGQVLPSLETAAAIEKLTEGKITALTWVSEKFPDRNFSS